MAWVAAAEGVATLTSPPETFEALFMREYPRVRAIAARTGLSAAEAEDVAQDVFSQFYRRHPADAPYAPAWLRRAAAHTALNAIRSRKRRAAREERDVASGAALLSAPSSDEPGHALEAEEVRRAVRAAMRRLSRRHAAILALRYGGMSYAEVGTALGVPSSHVGAMLHRAEAAFIREFDHESLG